MLCDVAFLLHSWWKTHFVWGLNDCLIFFLSPPHPPHHPSTVLSEIPSPGIPQQLLLPPLAVPGALSGEVTLKSHKSGEIKSRRAPSLEAGGEQGCFPEVFVAVSEIGAQGIAEWGLPVLALQGKCHL